MRKAYKVVGEFQGYFRYTDLTGGKHLKGVRKDDILEGMLFYLVKNDRYRLLEGNIDVDLKLSKDYRNFKVYVMSNDSAYSTKELNSLASAISLAILGVEEVLYNEYQVDSLV